MKHLKNILSKTGVLAVLAIIALSGTAFAAANCCPGLCCGATMPCCG